VRIQFLNLLTVIKFISLVTPFLSLDYIKHAPLYIDRRQASS